MKTKLQQFKEEFLKQLQDVTDSDKLHEFELKFLSRKGELAQIMGSIKDLSDEARKEAERWPMTLKPNCKSILIM